jgi:hypothetical protein
MKDSLVSAKPLMRGLFVNNKENRIYSLACKNILLNARNYKMIRIPE